jgi:hypothetical protein
VKGSSEGSSVGGSEGKWSMVSVLKARIKQSCSLLGLGPDRVIPGFGKYLSSHELTSEREAVKGSREGSSVGSNGGKQ